MFDLDPVEEGVSSPTGDGDPEDQDALPNRDPPGPTRGRSPSRRDDDDDYSDSDAWGDEWPAEDEVWSSGAHRTGVNRRPRGPRQPGEKRRGKPQGAAAKAAAVLAAGNVAEAHSCVQL